jgi:hypothetical protein
MLSEEEFQMQLAMALSASNSDGVGDLDGDQIRKAKLMSLDRHGAHRDDGHTAESLSRRYWVRHRCALCAYTMRFYNRFC